MVKVVTHEAKISDLIDFCREKGLILQLIELLDLRHSGLSGDIDAIERRLATRVERVRTREMHRRKKNILDGAEVEVVRPVDNTDVLRQMHRPTCELGRQFGSIIRFFSPGGSQPPTTNIYNDYIHSLPLHAIE